MKYDYDIAVIGAGGAGLVASKTAAGLGKKVALIEKGKIGGSCTHTGCIPSKSLIRAAGAAHALTRHKEFGLGPGAVADTGGVMASVRATVAEVSGRYNADYFEKLGIRFISGEARFLNRHEADISGRRLSADKFIIATGTAPAVPDIPGLTATPFLTSENLFDLERIPGSLAVLGGGPIGIEMAQAFSRLGAEVTVIEAAHGILAREDRELAGMLDGILNSEGVEILADTVVSGISSQYGKKILTTMKNGQERRLPPFDALLVSAGRRPNTGLSLENAGVEFNDRGVVVDDGMRTAAANIYACGDVAGPYLFSHMAEYQGVIAAVNSSLPFKRKADYSSIPWVTFSDPELSHLGMTEEEAQAAYPGRIRVYRSRYDANDRAITEREEKGMAKFILSHDYRLLGAHILGHNSADSLVQAQMLNSFDIPFTALYSAIFPYPAYSDVVRSAGKQAYVDRLRNNFIIKLLRRFV